ncbi:MBL fold metallo-hydrolase [Ktedonobacteria bacterium brp13]|nr:MBL fold metallo-hydrolase [Ktedonobacteria bacterium brp13]
MQEITYKSCSIILAPNPSVMTGPGTNTIVLGGGIEGATVVDPAVDQREYLETVIHAGAARGCIRRILITHGHADHIGGALALREMLGVHIYAASRRGLPFADCELPDGMLIPAGDECLRVIATPGHRFDHLSFLLEESRTLIAGDLLAGTGTVVIIPPEGNLQEYLASLHRLQQLDLNEIIPAHGPIIKDPQQRLADYIAHRLEREQQILTTLQQVAATIEPGMTIPAIVQQIYHDIDPQLHMMAGKSVLAHLLKLEGEGRVKCHEHERWSLLP